MYLTGDRSHNLKIRSLIIIILVSWLLFVADFIHDSWNTPSKMHAIDDYQQIKIDLNHSHVMLLTHFEWILNIGYAQNAVHQLFIEAYQNSLGQWPPPFEIQLFIIGNYSISLQFIIKIHVIWLCQKHAIL